MSDGDEWENAYILVGQCGAGLGAEWALVRGLEIAGEEDLVQEDVTVRLSDYFELEVDAVNGASGNFTFDPALTPIITGISRTNGTTAGGTTVVLNVTGLPIDVGIDDIEVYLAGIKCALVYGDIGSYRDQHLCDWSGVDCDSIGLVRSHGIDAASSANMSQLTCLTNEWDYSGDALWQKVELIVPHGTAAIAQPREIAWSYANLWSSATTWGGDVDNMPETGDTVVVTTGEYIFMDVTPPSLYLLIIYVRARARERASVAH